MLKNYQRPTFLKGMKIEHTLTKNLKATYCFLSLSDSSKTITSLELLKVWKTRLQLFILIEQQVWPKDFKT